LVTIESADRVPMLPLCLFNGKSYKFSVLQPLYEINMQQKTRLFNLISHNYGDNQI